MPIFEYDMMKNVYIERAYFSVSQKMYLPSANICKRIGIFILLFIFVYLIIPWKHDGKIIYNKWKFDRYVGNLYDENIVQRKQTNDYMFPFLARIISDKQSVFRICDELDLLSCTNNSRYE